MSTWRYIPLTFLYFVNVYIASFTAMWYLISSAGYIPLVDILFQVTFCWDICPYKNMFYML